MKQSVNIPDGLLARIDEYAKSLEVPVDRTTAINALLERGLASPRSGGSVYTPRHLGGVTLALREEFDCGWDREDYVEIVLLTAVQFGIGLVPTVAGPGDVLVGWAQGEDGSNGFQVGTRVYEQPSDAAAEVIKRLEAG